jgi:hypothetical protein
MRSYNSIAPNGRMINESWIGDNVQQYFGNKIKPLHVSANDGYHRKATNTSKEMLHMFYMHVVLYWLH